MTEEMTEEQLAKWRHWHKAHLCCEKAKPGGFCVCLVLINCEEHGIKHVGTHDLNRSLQPSKKLGGL